MRPFELIQSTRPRHVVMCTDTTRNVMPTDKELQLLHVTVNIPLTGDWEKDQPIVKEIAMQNATAETFYVHARIIESLFNNLTYGTPAAPNYPQRKGLLRRVHDELYPLAHFAKLYFSASPEVVIKWQLGSQNFDATVDDQREGKCRSNICYLEVTTLQDEEDANQLEELSEQGSIEAIGNPAQANHLRKVELLRRALEKKGRKNYPEKTALLVYTDEDRFRYFYIGMQPPLIDQKRDFEAVLGELKHLLEGFSHVFIYSRNEIYCMLQPHSEQSNAC